MTFNVARMTSILSNIGVNFSRKSAAKKAAAAASNSPNSTVNGHNVASAVNGGGISATPIPVGSLGRKGCGG